MYAAIPAGRRPVVLADVLPGTLARDIGLVIGGAVLVGLAAQVALPIPGSPVPVSGQTFGVLLAGAALGWRRGIASMLVYLLAGVAGVPWFADHGHGIGFPTFGYILGFVVAAGVVGALAGRGGDRTPLRTIATMALGTLLIYALGAPYLMADLHLSLATAIREGVTPFLIGDAIKVALAAGLFPGTWALLNKRSRRQAADAAGQ